MWPSLFIFGVSFPTYNLFLAGGLLVGLMTLFFAARRKRIALSFVADHAVWFVLVTLFVARLAEVLLSGYPLASFPFFWQDTGFDFYSGALGGVLALALICLIRREKFTTWLDPFALAVAAGLVFHHLGQLMAGTGYGKPTSLPWGIVYTNPDAAVLTTLPVHPVQAYAAVYTLLAFLIASVLFKRTTIVGKTGAVLTFLLALGTFLLEFLRDNSAPVWGFLREGQYVALILMLGSALILTRVKLAARPTADELSLHNPSV